MKLAGSTILITGGTSGIGLEFVRQLIQQGVADILITGRNAGKLDEVKNEFPGIHTFQSDVSKSGDIEALYENITSQFPNLNILINNAGIMRNLDMLNAYYSLDEITDEIDVNLNGTIRMVHQFLPHLRGKSEAAILNVSSGLAFVPFPASPVYSASKSGVHFFTLALRLQLKKTSVKVFELAPPSTETPLLDAFSEEIESSQNMPVDKMVSTGIQGLLIDKYEIRPGLSNTLKIMSRVAPSFILNFMDKSIEKARKK